MLKSKRIEKFDTLKVWCMVLVVIVHTLINSYGDVGQEIIRFFCLCYTMPMFAFISGWFSKEKSDIRKNVKHLFLPCIVMTIVNDGIMYAVNPQYHLNVLTPGFAMWYLWALFVYRSILPYIVRIPHVIFLSFILSWVVGVIPQINANYSASRSVCFLPYFLLGHKMARDIQLSKIHVNIMKPMIILTGGISVHRIYELVDFHPPLSWIYNSYRI